MRISWRRPASFGTGNGTKFIVDAENECALPQGRPPRGGQSFTDALNNWLDKPTAMVQLMVKVYEVKGHQRWRAGAGTISPGRNGPWRPTCLRPAPFAEHAGFHNTERARHRATGKPGPPACPGNSLSAHGSNLAWQYDVSSAFFDFLAVKGKARVLNSMKLAALNTRPASLTAGDQILYYAVKTDDDSKGGVRDTGQPFPGQRQAGRGRNGQSARQQG